MGMNRPGSPDLWSIVLAAGDGTRLAPLVRRLHGDDRPKQFAVLRGQRSLLQETIQRMAALAASSRTVVVVSERHRALARKQLGPAVDLVGQPRNVGTGPGILLPLARVLSRDPGATVVVTPSDHHFRRPARFISGIREAARDAAATSSGVCILGVEADRPATDLGWIVPDEAVAPLPGATLVRRFVEKPDAAQARSLFQGGALWNTFVMVGRAEAFWTLASRLMPAQTRSMNRYRMAVGSPREARVLQGVYEDLAAADFSREVLARAPGLGVVSVDGSGWSDWGTPERLFESLRATSELAALERRMVRGQVAPEEPSQETHNRSAPEPVSGSVDHQRSNRRKTCIGGAGLGKMSLRSTGLVGRGPGRSSLDRRCWRWQDAVPKRGSSPGPPGRR
jgi:mannose-1-phosphate guanylyltransferase